MCVCGERERERERGIRMWTPFSGARDVRLVASRDSKVERLTGAGTRFLHFFSVCAYRCFELLTPIHRPISVSLTFLMQTVAISRQKPALGKKKKKRSERSSTIPHLPLDGAKKIRTYRPFSPSGGWGLAGGGGEQANVNGK